MPYMFKNSLKFSTLYVHSGYMFFRVMRVYSWAIFTEIAKRNFLDLRSSFKGCVGKSKADRGILALGSFGVSVILSFKMESSTNFIKINTYFKCEICENTFSINQKKNKHIKNAHGEAKFVTCNVC